MVVHSRPCLDHGSTGWLTGCQLEGRHGHFQASSGHGHVEGPGTAEHRCSAWIHDQAPHLGWGRQLQGGEQISRVGAPSQTRISMRFNVEIDDY